MLGTIEKLIEKFKKKLFSVEKLFLFRLQG